MLLIIDNFDSFIFNIVQCFQTLDVNVHLLRANQASIELCKYLNPKALVIGPGPGSPGQALASSALLTEFTGKIPILGICLGHQCIGESFGGKVICAKQPMHGKISHILHDKRGIFREMPQAFKATRYHSLIIERASLPSCLDISAETDDGEIMGVRHRHLPIEGVQFHPESCMTQSGQLLFSNFLNQL